MPFPCLAYTAFYVLRDQETYESSDYESEFTRYVPETTTTEITQELEEQIRRRIWMECLDQTRVDPERVMRLKHGRRNAFATNRKLKHWVLCVLTKKGLMSERGVFYIDEARKLLRKADIKLGEKMIEECLTTKSLPPEQIAWLYLKCYYNKKYENITNIGLF